MTYIDSNISRKKEITKGKVGFYNKIPIFSALELNIVAACNRECDFCPVSSGDYYKKYGLKGRLGDDFLCVLIDNLKAINYQGSIIISGYSEPLLHTKLFDIIESLKTQLIGVEVEVNTNGDLLTVDKLNKFSEVGLDALIISKYDGPHQVDYFNNIIEKSDLSNKKTELRRRYFNNKDYGLTISNRGGLIDANKYRSVDEKPITSFPIARTCYYPFYFLKLDFNGAVLLCSHDWQRKRILGNIFDQNLLSIWSSNEYKDIRLSLSNKNRDFEPCKSCDVYGDLIGVDNYNKWLEYYDEDGL